ncbi:hypothetical protein BE221DRAFT_79895 [Ostreococcus tauri]|uniref:Uncharacterized protein n=3 Tax=Ostreococcus tauri TaxID=70448 RepID=A0A1Y5I2F8_OSTTA|nr:hypothetical protein BE221DRAFT_79895 [Ostreococcus tauri]
MRERRGRRDARDGDARRRTDAPRETTTRQVQTTTARKEDVDRDDDVPSLRALRSAHELVVAERDEARGIRERARHCESEARRRLERMKHERDRAREDLKRVLIVVAQVRDGAADVRDLFDFCEASSDAGRDVG